MSVTAERKHPFTLWITGLSGAGKSTLAHAVVQELHRTGITVAALDGDAFREILGNDLGHSEADRIKNAFRIARMCRFLNSQSINVVCSTMSLYPEVWRWNRENIPGYIEVYLRVSRDVLIARDPKGVYQKALAGKEGNIVGFDLPFNEPTDPDFIIDGDEVEPSKLVEHRDVVMQLISGRSS